MKRFVIALVVSAAACAFAAAAALAVTPSSATGKGAYTTSTGVKVDVQITAYQLANGSFKGQQQYTSSPLSWHGATPTCYAVNGTTAIFAGPITSSTDPTLVGQFYVIEVVDSTSKSVPDQIGVDYVNKQPNTCTFHGPLYSITAGNLTVR